jgi:steroid delta-isomerase-like uncharacterized protein
MATTPETRSPGQLARHLFELIFDRRDVDAARQFWTESSTNRFLALGIDVRGPDQLAAFFRELHAAFPDLRMAVESVVEDERQAVVQWSLSATFDGAPFQGIEPTDRRVELRGCDAFRFTDDGKLDTNTIYYDGADFARQIGMLPPRGSAADRALLAGFNAQTRLRRRLRRG